MHSDSYLNMIRLIIAEWDTIERPPWLLRLESGAASCTRRVVGQTGLWLVGFTAVGGEYDAHDTCGLLRQILDELCCNWMLLGESRRWLLQERKQKGASCYRQQKVPPLIHLVQVIGRHTTQRPALYGSKHTLTPTNPSLTRFRCSKPLTRYAGDRQQRYG